MLTIRRKIEGLARELANNEDIGLDEATLLKLFESNTDRLLSSSAANRFTFDEMPQR